MKRPRSPAQIAASRRNGARSTGPRTAVTRARSAKNAVKHGLFRTRSLQRAAIPAQVAELADQLAGVAPSYFDAALHVETIILGELRLAEVAEMLLNLHEQLGVSLASDAAPAEVSELITSIARLTRYQRRFRRERDRALATLDQLARAHDQTQR